MAHHRDTSKERRWLDLIRAWQQSGLNVRQFCQRRRLNEPSFYVWRRTLQRRGLIDESPPAGRAATPAFVQVTLPSDAQAGIDIVLGQGRLLRVRPGFDSNTLCQLLRLLEEPSC